MGCDVGADDLLPTGEHRSESSWGPETEAVRDSAQRSDDRTRISVAPGGG